MADTCNYNYLQIIHYSYNSLNCVAYSDTIQIELEDFLRQPRSTRQYSLMAVAIHREGCLVCSSVRTFFSISCHVNTNHNHFVCGQVNSSKLVSQGAHWATSELGQVDATSLAKSQHGVRREDSCIRKLSVRQTLSMQLITLLHEYKIGIII